MSSAFFRRPTDGSSNSSSESEESEEDDLVTQQTENSVEGEVQTATTESLPSHGSISLGVEIDAPANSFPDVDRHRTNLISALLEDFARNRASDYMNEANPGFSFNKLSPEVQPLAQSLYRQVSQSLAINGIIPASNDVDGDKQARAAYLAGLELALGGVQNLELPHGKARSQLRSVDQQLAVSRVSNQQQSLFPQSFQQSMANLSLHQGQTRLSSPYSELVLSAETRRSHYESSFQQLRLLGKGGFGRVYHAYNIFDKKEYAVKKIPLSPRLSQRYREAGHKELENILREVQALAQLEHSNVVRYHATWIEEPRRAPDALYRPRKQSLTVQGRKLIADRPTHTPPIARKASAQLQVPERSDGIVFGSDSRPISPARDIEGAAEQWTANETDPEPSSARPSEIFTDGNARSGLPRDLTADDSVYVLHVQMSVYPTTLAQYLAPVPTNSRSAPSSPAKRHCFHLVPALRLLMGILCGLQYIHSRGLIHRDIKPSNIFISTQFPSATMLIPDGYHDVGSCVGCTSSSSHFVNPRIGDFGLVAELARDGDIEATGGHDRTRPVGTEYYRPPTSIDSKGKSKFQPHVDEKVDVFALGVILIELLWPCLTSTERMHVLRDVQKGKIPVGLAEKVDKEGHQEGTGQKVTECISGMLERDPRRRWGCAQIKDWVEKILGKCKISTANNDSNGSMDGIDLEGMSRVKSIDEATEQATSLGAQAH